VASHDLEFVLRTCARVIVLDGGRIRAVGPAADIVTDAELLERHGLACPLGWREMRAEGILALLRAERENGEQQRG
jgi:ABC-type cobalamin/Fe3+-siderophores transport system ATPase subunit